MARYALGNVADEPRNEHVTACDGYDLVRDDLTALTEAQYARIKEVKARVPAGTEITPRFVQCANDDCTDEAAYLRIRRTPVEGMNPISITIAL